MEDTEKHVKEIAEYINNIEKELKELNVKVNSDGSVSGKSIGLIEINGNRAKELTAKLQGFRDALKILGIED